VLFAAIAVVLTAGLGCSDSLSRPGAASQPEVPPTQSKGKAMAEATFGAGCFWGVEATFAEIEGVTDTAVGFMGGHAKDPSYEDVCTGTTGHAEVVHVTYDPDRVSYDDLLDVFWQCHDPTSVNRQGPDIGDQYRSVIFYHTPEQEVAAQASKQTLEASGRHGRPIATRIEPASTFWRAEEYHQNYLEKHGMRGSGYK
jgi:peptide-methionine (S)-S-oxide reductase